MAETAGTDGMDGQAGADKRMAGATLHGIPPLMAHSTAAAMAASAVGFGLANQMAGAWLGLMRGALEASIEMAEAMGVSPEFSEPTGQAETPEPAVSKAPAVVVARSVAKPKQEKPAAPVAVMPAQAKPAKPAKATAVAKTRVSTGDDLKRIVGIGPKLETLLKARGIRRYADLAALGAEGLAALDAELGLDGRSAKDGWLAAAEALAPKKRKT